MDPSNSIPNDIFTFDQTLIRDLHFLQLNELILRQVLISSDLD